VLTQIMANPLGADANPRLLGQVVGQGGRGQAARQTPTRWWSCSIVRTRSPSHAGVTLRGRPGRGASSTPRSPWRSNRWMTRRTAAGSIRTIVAVAGGM
jgi:hypothetical protein